MLCVGTHDCDAPASRVSEPAVSTDSLELHTLTSEQKDFNRRLLKKRIKVENVIREIKTFSIMSGTCRNR
ncbi:transposase family protein [Desulfonema ishimotonii]|uniref:transposase family protein n=1 Tax=Desulfonema ishimotonii TaxID=45657 RepID=UPI00350E4170